VAAAFSRNDILAALRWSLAVFGKFVFIIFITGPLYRRKLFKNTTKSRRRTKKLLSQINVASYGES